MYLGRCRLGITINYMLPTSSFIQGHTRDFPARHDNPCAAPEN